MMIKKYKWTLIFTSILILLPIAIGMLLWNMLPEQMPVHWGVTGEVDGWAHKSFTIFGLPIILLGLHWLCVLGTVITTKTDTIKGKLLTFVLWICPLLSLLLESLTYAVSLGYKVNVPFVIILVMGVIMIIVGNYLPKVKRNPVLGIKLPWTINSDENWYRTHRLGGFVFVLGGVIILATAFLQNSIIFLATILLIVIIPTVYSYIYYCKYEKKSK